MILKFSLHMYAKIGLATGKVGGVLWSGVNNLKWYESSYVLFNTHSNASHSNSRELFVVGGRHTHERAWSICR